MRFRETFQARALRLGRERDGERWAARIWDSRPAVGVDVSPYADYDDDEEPGFLNGVVVDARRAVEQMMDAYVQEWVIDPAMVVCVACAGEGECRECGGRGSVPAPPGSYVFNPARPVFTSAPNGKLPSFEVSISGESVNLLGADWLQSEQFLARVEEYRAKFLKIWAEATNEE